MHQMRCTRRTLPRTPPRALERWWSHRPRQRLPPLQQLPRRRPPPRLGHHHGIRPTPLADPTRQHRPETPAGAVVSPTDHATRRHRSLTHAAPQPDSLHPARPGPHLLFENSIENSPPPMVVVSCPWPGILSAQRVSRLVAGAPRHLDHRMRRAGHSRTGRLRPPDGRLPSAGRGASRVRRASRPHAAELEPDHRHPDNCRHNRPRHWRSSAPRPPDEKGIGWEGPKHPSTASRHRPMV